MQLILLILPEIILSYVWINYHNCFAWIIIVMSEIDWLNFSCNQLLHKGLNKKALLEFSISQLTKKSFQLLFQRTL